MTKTKLQYVILHAQSLASKWGFEDGDVLSRFFHINDFDKDHLILADLVKAHLKPLLPAEVELEEFHTSHNPIRATEATKHLVSDSPIMVKVPFTEIKEAMNKRRINYYDPDSDYIAPS